MRSSRSLRLATLLFAGVLAVVTVLRAQESPPATAPAERTAPAQATQAAPAPPATAGEPAADAPAGPAAPPAPRGATPTRFEPTEKVRADFDVSFPIDI
jgi:hypothetical protein